MKRFNEFTNNLDESINQENVYSVKVKVIAEIEYVIDETSKERAKNASLDMANKIPLSSIGYQRDIGRVISKDFEVTSIEIDD